MIGAGLVIAGVCTAAWPSGDGPSVFTQVRPRVAVPMRIMLSQLLAWAVAVCTSRVAQADMLVLPVEAVRSSAVV